MIKVTAIKTIVRWGSVEQEITTQFSDQVILVAGELGKNAKPSKIRHGLSGQTIRDN